MHVLFDFDGTLVDSFECVMNHTIYLADVFNFKKISKDEVAELRDLSTKELVKFLKIPIYRIPALIRHMRAYVHQEILHLKPIEHIHSVVETLFNAGVDLGILTSNSIENVTMWLDAQNMRHFFDFVHIESNYLSKKYLIKKTLKTHKIDKSQAYYICDETRDIDAAQKNGVRSIAVTWGYNSERALIKYQPSFIAHHPKDILKIVGIS